MQPADRRMRAHFGVVLAILSLLALFTAPSASARTYAQAIAQCPDGSTCLYEHVNYEGRYVSFRYGIADFRAFGFNDLASSFVNDSNSIFCMFENVDYAWDNYLGRSYRIQPRAYDPSLHDGIGFADIASSGFKVSQWPVVCNGSQVN